MRTFLRDVSAQIVAATCVAAVGLIGVRLASLTPVIAEYAPFSYLIAFLLVLATLAAASLYGVKAWKAAWPTPPKSAAATSKDHSAQPAYDNAALRTQIEDLTRKVSDFEARPDRTEDLETDIAASAEEARDLRRDFADLALRFQWAEQEIHKIQPHMDWLNNEVRRRRIEQIKSQMKEAWQRWGSALPDPQNRDCDFALAMDANRYGRLAERFGDALCNQGEITAKVKEAEDKVRSNARYLHIPEAEKGWWANEEEKQKWHLKKAAWDVLKEVYENPLKYWKQSNE